MLKKLFDSLFASKQYKFLRHYALSLYNKFSEDPVWIMASGISFNFIICAIPFVLILLSVVGTYLPKEGTSEYINHSLGNVVGITPELKEKITTTALRAIDELSNYSTLTAFIGIIGVIWTASGLFSTIRDALNKIYKIDIEVFYIWAKLKDILMVFIVMVFFILSFATTSLYSVLASTGESFLKRWFDIGGIKQFAAIPVGLLFSFLMFYMIYTIVPHGKIKKKISLVSAISAAVMWEILKLIFTYYLVEFANYTKIYGTYAAIVAVIFWIYYSSFIFVLGAEIGQVYHEKLLLKKINK